MSQERPDAPPSESHDASSTAVKMHGSGGGSGGLLRQIGAFIWEGRKFWLIPIVAALLLVGGLVVFSEMSPLSPFIYPFF